MKVAALQMCSGTDVAANVKAFEALVREAAGQGASYVQSPEMTGLVQRDGKALASSISTQDRDPLFANAQQLAKELGIFIHVGSTPIDLGEGKIANRAAVFSCDGNLLALYDKIHMFDVDLDNGEKWRESAIYRAGSHMGMVNLNGAKFGLAICYDLRFPELFRQQALAGASALTVPAAFTHQTGMAHWHILLRARAIENGAYVIAAAQGGTHEDGRHTYGHSLIIDPWGTIVAEKAGQEPGILMADIDLTKVTQARAKIPNLKNSQTFSTEQNP